MLESFECVIYNSGLSDSIGSKDYGGYRAGHVKSYHCDSILSQVSALVGGGW